MTVTLSRAARRPAAPVGDLTAEPLRGGVLRQLSWWRSRRRRERQLHRPLQAPVSLGSYRLPGTTSDTELYQAHDAYDRPFALLLVPETGHASLVLALTPPDGDLLDADGAEWWIADLGVWLALLVHEPDLTGCAVSLALAGRARPGDGAADGGPDGTDSQLKVILQLTWRTRGPQGRSDAAALAAELGARLPHVINGLHRCQVGSAQPLPAEDLVHLVGRAYRPDREPDAVPSWPSVAPRVATQAWDRLRHLPATSLTWCLSEVPPHLVLSGVLAQLAAAHGPACRKAVQTRVTLLYRPEPGALGAQGAGAEPAVPDGGPGQGTPRLTSLVTVTVTGGSDDLDEAVAGLLSGVTPSLRPWLRPLYGSQAAAFAAAIPTGTLLGVHTAAPTLLREPGG